MKGKDMTINYKGQRYKRVANFGWCDDRSLKVPAWLANELETQYRLEAARILEKEKAERPFMLPGALSSTKMVKEKNNNPNNEISIVSQNGKVVFGRYPQGKGGEVLPISWFVLEEDSDSLLLISEFCLNTMPMFHKDQKEIYKSWYNSYLRAWLNTEFLDAAFTSEERELIKLRQHNGVVDVNDNFVKKYSPIVDEVSLISENEIIHLFRFNDSRLKAQATEYAKELKISLYNPYTYAYWWTRGDDNKKGQFISPSGERSGSL